MYFTLTLSRICPCTCSSPIMLSLHSLVLIRSSSLSTSLSLLHFICISVLSYPILSSSDLSSSYRYVFLNRSFVRTLSLSYPNFILSLFDLLILSLSYSIIFYLYPFRYQIPQPFLPFRSISGSLCPEAMTHNNAMQSRDGDRRAGIGRI